MALWLTRAGRHGEYENQFLEEGRVYLTWHGLRYDLSAVKDKQELRQLLRQLDPAASEKKVINNSGQIWPFAKEINNGDWVVLPSKHRPVIIVGEVTGPYVFHPKGPDPFLHSREVKWIATDVPRSAFDQDLLYSFGAFMTICKIKRNDAEKRIRAMAGSGWKMGTGTGRGAPTASQSEDTEGREQTDLEELARDEIAKLIMAKFKGHGLARLVDAILRAQGYITHLSSPGADKGIDILAAPGPLGFGQPRICVQVKSEQGTVDRPTLDQLIGTMQNTHADQGLLVAWGGFKQSVDREVPTQFFRVRMWDQRALIQQLLSHYDKLDEEIRAELPLKRIWTVALDDED